MKKARSTTGIALWALLIMLAVSPRAAEAQADLSGTWQLAVNTDNGLTNPTMTLSQQGTTLTGEYSSQALGVSEVRGNVDGNDVTITFTASLQGQSIPVVYSGTIAEDGTLSGTLDIADGMLTGTFTATRS
jgi:hypothetical protein